MDKKDNDASKNSVRFTKIYTQHTNYLQKFYVCKSTVISTYCTTTNWYSVLTSLNMLIVGHKTLVCIKLYNLHVYIGTNYWSVIISKGGKSHLASAGLRLLHQNCVFKVTLLTSSLT